MTADPIDVLLRHGEEHGCIHMTELYELVQSLEYLEACTTCHHEERIAVCGACDQPHSEVRPQLIAGIHGGQTSTS